jgi:hypothetical protein
VSETLTEEQAMSMAVALRTAIDQPRRKSEPATKTILIDFFGIPNAGKTRATENVERFFRRAGYNVMCPPETAEIGPVRNRSSELSTIFQMRHVAGVTDWMLNLSYNRDFHMAIVSRGLIDMLYWYERGREKKLFDETHISAMQGWIFEQLRLDLVDAFFYFIVDPSVALQREYEQSVTRRPGSNMNEESLHRAQRLYECVLSDIQLKMPWLPIFTIDTTHRTVQQTGQQVIELLLPHLLNRFFVP